MKIPSTFIFNARICAAKKTHKMDLLEIYNKHVGRRFPEEISSES